MAALRVACIGECMIELNQRDPATLALAYGGDTLNTAVYLARVNPSARLTVDYMTALGDDPYSDAMVAMWRDEGVGTGWVARLPAKLPGLYLIRIDEGGERRFFYYRSAAAARELFADATTLPLLAALAGYDLVYFSAITLSILGAAARAVIGRFLPCVDIALPTFDDEARLFGDGDAEATATRYAAAGVREIAVKLGAEGCLLDADGERRRVAVARPLTPVDTTAAGDSFNAGYLSGRLAGRKAPDAALAGHRLAAVTIAHRGAIVPREAMPDLGL